MTLSTLNKLLVIFIIQIILIIKCTKFPRNKEKVHNTICTKNSENMAQDFSCGSGKNIRIAVVNKLAKPYK